MMPWLLSTMIEWEFLALIYLLSVCRCWRFVLDSIATEASLIFAWCTWLSSWCVEMIFFMVYGDGCILRTYRVLGKGVVYAFILGVRMVSLLCHGILLIHI